MAKVGYGSSRSLAEHEAGQSDINVLLQSQLRRAQAQLEYYRALVEYNKSISQVHYLKGTLLDYNAITLKEGPWNQKAYWDALERARERDASYFIEYGWTRPNVQRAGPVPQGTGSDAPRGNGNVSTNPSSRPEEVPTPLDSRDESEVEQAGLFSTTLQKSKLSARKDPSHDPDLRHTSPYTSGRRGRGPR